MKSKICIFLSFLLVMSMLAGCSQDDQSAQYNEAKALFESGDYDAAASLFEKLGGYSDARLMVKECHYKKAKQLHRDGSMLEAIALLEDMNDYLDSEKLVEEYQYEYIQDHYDKNDEHTVAFLGDLRKKRYKDTEELFYKLYTFKVNMAINFDRKDHTTHQSNVPQSVHYGSPIAHIAFLDGPSDQEVEFTVEQKYLLKIGLSTKTEWRTESKKITLMKGEEYCWTLGVHGGSNVLKSVFTVYDKYGNELIKKTIKTPYDR